MRRSIVGTLSGLPTFLFFFLVFTFALAFVFGTLAPPEVAASLPKWARSVLLVDGEKDIASTRSEYLNYFVGVPIAALMAAATVFLASSSRNITRAQAEIAATEFVYEKISALNADLSAFADLLLELENLGIHTIKKVKAAIESNENPDLATELEQLRSSGIKFASISRKFAGNPFWSAVFKADTIIDIANEISRQTDNAEEAHLQSTYYLTPEDASPLEMACFVIAANPKNEEFTVYENVGAKWLSAIVKILRDAKFDDQIGHFFENLKVERPKVLKIPSLRSLLPKAMLAELEALENKKLSYEYTDQGGYPKRVSEQPVVSVSASFFARTAFQGRNKSLR